MDNDSAVGGFGVDQVEERSWCGFSALASWATATHLREVQRGGPLDVTNVSLGGMLFGQLPIAVLGALVISGEYSTGGIKASLTAVPQRLRFLSAKMLVFTVLALVVGMITSFVAFFVGMVFFNAHDAGAGLGDPHVLRAVIGGGLFLTAAGLLGFALGTILRHTAGAITVSVALLFVIRLVIGSIPQDLVRTVNEYFFSSAGQRVMTVLPSHADWTHVLDPWPGYIVFVIEVGILLVIGAALMRRRDA